MNEANKDSLTLVINHKTKTIRVSRKVLTAVKGSEMMNMFTGKYAVRPTHYGIIPLERDNPYVFSMILISDPPDRFYALFSQNLPEPAGYYVFWNRPGASQELANVKQIVT